MEILKHRDDREFVWKYEFHCSCGCQFIADHTEIAEREKCINGRLWAICPECGKKIEPIDRDGWKEIKEGYNSKSSNMDGIELIRKERERQINVEGYNAEHDDAEKADSLSTAGAIYALPWNIRTIINATRYWPWDKSFYKPSKSDHTDARIKELVKAGALIAAEIDRLKRNNGK